MKLNGVVRFEALSVILAFTSVALTAQPLKNWSAPQYWQPNQMERAAGGKATPELKFSANAVSTNALTFVAITPCRLMDTRGGSFNGISPFSGPSLTAAVAITIPVQSTTEASANTAPAPCGVIPTIAQAYSLNLTVVPHAGGPVDYISMWPTGGIQPSVSTLDDPQGAIVSNAAIVAAGTPTGGINLYNSGPAATDIILDMNGYFAAPTDLNNNTGIGMGTLSGSNTGSANTAAGSNALASNTTGSNNTATGAMALQNNTSGSNDVAIGYQAATNVVAGSNNIHIGNLGAAGDNNVIRIGTEGTQTSTSIAGIYGEATAAPNAIVCADSTGKLGTSGCSPFGTNIIFFSEGESGGAQCTVGALVLSASVIYPTNFLPADGRTIPISGNTALFSLIGVNYGGNGTSNFALPNLTAAAPNNTQYLICLSGVFP